jgi:DNA-binding MarR family transcriptional regulator
MDLIRVAGLLQPDAAIPGQPVSLSQAFALHELDTGAPLSQRDLAERLGLEKSTVSRIAAEMERQGMLVRERDPDNRRVYRLRLTDLGRAIHAGIAGTFHDHYVRWMATMSRSECDALLTALPALVRAMRDDLAPWRQREPTSPPPGAGPGSQARR